MKITNEQIKKINEIVPNFFDPAFNPDDAFLQLYDAAGDYMFASASMKNFYDWFGAEDYHQNYEELKFENIFEVNSFEEFNKLDPEDVLDTFEEVQEDIYEFWDINNLERIKKLLQSGYENYPIEINKEDYNKIMEILNKTKTVDSYPDEDEMFEEVKVNKKGNKLVDLLGEAQIKQIYNNMFGGYDDEESVEEMGKEIIEFCKNNNYDLERFVKTIDPDYRAKLFKIDGDTIFYTVEGTGDDLEGFLAPLINIYLPGYKLSLLNRQTENSFKSEE